jgi:hypothetical protein
MPKHRILGLGTGFREYVSLLSRPVPVQVGSSKTIGISLQ